MAETCPSCGVPPFTMDLALTIADLTDRLAAARKALEEIAVPRSSYDPAAQIARRALAELDKDTPDG